MQYTIYLDKDGEENYVISRETLKRYPFIQTSYLCRRFLQTVFGTLPVQEKVKVIFSTRPKEGKKVSHKYYNGITIGSKWIAASYFQSDSLKDSELGDTFYVRAGKLT